MSTEAHSPVAERALLGAMILANDSQRAAIFATIERDWLYLESHRLIWDAMTMVERERKTFDTVNLLITLRDSETDKQAGGGSYLSLLAAVVPTVHGWKHYADTVREDYERRRLAAAYAEAEAGLGSSPLESASKLVSDINDVLAKQSEQSVYSSESAAEMTVAMIHDAAARVASGRRVTWTTSDDELTQIIPIAPGSMHVLGMRSGGGKTSVACNGAQFTAAAGEAFGFHSIEMPIPLLNLRLMTRVMPTNELDAMQGHPDSKFDADANRYLSGPAKNPIYITRPDPTIEDVERRVRYLYSVHGVRYHAVDYFQLMRTSKKFGSRSDELNYIGQRLKQLTVDLPENSVLVLAQLNKTWSTSIPSKEDIRYGSGLCDSADGVTLGWRPGKGTDDDSEIKFRLDKGRFGGETTVSLQWVQGRIMGRYDEFYAEMANRFDACMKAATLELHK